MNKVEALVNLQFIMLDSLQMLLLR